MNRSIIISISFICLCFSAVVCLPGGVQGARKRANFTGTIQDSTYTDTESGFSVKLPPGWAHIRGKDGDLCHLRLFEDDKVQKEINKEFGTSIQANAMEFWIVKTAATPKECLDSILSDSSRSELRKAFLEHLDINLESSMSRGIENYRRKDTILAGRPAEYWRGFRNRIFRVGTANDMWKDRLQVIAVNCEDVLLVCLSRRLESDFLVAKTIDETIQSLSFQNQKMPESDSSSGN